MAVVSASGTTSYNGVTFGPRTETMSVRTVPRYDRAGRTVTHHEITITLRSDITIDAGGTIDTTLETLRKQLLQPAGELRYQDKGYGNLVVNVPNGAGARDALWGPKPQVLNWKPKADNRSAEIVWTVVVAIPVCASGTAKYKFALMESGYSASYSQDASGYNTRRINGHIKIPQTRRVAGDKKMQDMVDRYREQVNPSIPPGFRRTGKSFDISEDKCELVFSFTDAEMPPNIPPPGVVQVRASHTVQSQSKGLLGSVSLWMGSLSANYEMAKDKPRADAYKHFLALMRERTAGPRAAGRRNQKDGSTSFVLRQFQMSEPDIYGKESAAFACAYTFTTNMATILVDSGLWRQVSTSNYNLWAQSLANTAFHIRGANKIGLTNLDADVIVDLCIEDKPKIVSPVKPIRTIIEKPVGGPQNQLPTAADSWLDYKTNIRIQVRDNAVELKPTPKKAIEPKPKATKSKAIKVDPKQPSRSFIDDDSGGSVSPSSSGSIVETPANREDIIIETPITSGYKSTTAVQSSSESTVHYLSAPTVTVVFTGQALRAGYAVPIPNITEVGGAKAMPMNDENSHFGNEVVENWLGLPIVRATWRLRYVLTEIPKGFPITRGPIA